MQNPALGAALVWRFACGYAPPKAASGGVPLPLAFVVLPLVLQDSTRKAIEATQGGSGLRKFEERFSASGDVLYALNDRARSMRGLSFRSVGIAVASGLVTLLPEKAAIWPRTYAPARRAGQSEQALMKAAEKCGAWCSTMTLFELSGILRVEF
jgi:hypothetical protein